MGSYQSVLTDVLICVAPRPAEVANSPINKVMDLAAGVLPVTAEDPTARTSMGRRKHRAAPSTNHRKDLRLARAEARAMRLLVDS